MANYIPFGPWDNPKLHDGYYAASLESIRRITRSETGDEMFAMHFRLEDSDQLLCTRLYLPKKFSPHCQHRLSYFCQSIGMEPHDLDENPEVAVGRRITLEVTTVQPLIANKGAPYSDVKRFLPAGFQKLAEENEVNAVKSGCRKRG